MGIGAVFGAILTMYTAVATRAREIATLRALGFETSSVLVSILAESLVLGAIGGIIGAAIAYFGLFPSIVAYLCWNSAVAEVGATRAGVFVHLMPVFGTVLAIVFLGETFRAFHAVGFVLILAGIGVTTLAEKLRIPSA